jgi:hypothetical protein
MRSRADKLQEQVNWLILPVIIFFDQRLSHARLRTLSYLRVCVWLIIWFITSPSTFSIGTSEVIHGLTLHEKPFRKRRLHLLVSNQQSWRNHDKLRILMLQKTKDD